jgi:hypothetical protein
VIWYKPVKLNLRIPVDAVNNVTGCAYSAVNPDKSIWYAFIDGPAVPVENGAGNAVVAAEYVYSIPCDVP